MNVQMIFAPEYGQKPTDILTQEQIEWLKQAIEDVRSRGHGNNLYHKLPYDEKQMYIALKKAGCLHEVLV